MTAPYWSNTLGLTYVLLCSAPPYAGAFGGFFAKSALKSSCVLYTPLEVEKPALHGVRTASFVTVYVSVAEAVMLASSAACRLLTMILPELPLVGMSFSAPLET